MSPEQYDAWYETPRGAYRGAHWHTRCEVLDTFVGQPARSLSLRSGIVPQGG